MIPFHGVRFDQPSDDSVEYGDDDSSAAYDAERESDLCDLMDTFDERRGAR